MIFEKGSKITKYFVFICDGWGAKYGGINSINYDFLLALGDNNTQKIICLCVDATQKNIKEAKDHNITLINSTIDDIIDTQTSLLESCLAVCKSENLFWVGHDIKTGNWALNYKNAIKKGSLILFNHMDYNETYKPRKDSKTAKAKTEEQEILFNNADYIFAVGPKLFESAKDRNTKTGGKAKVFEFLPGLSKIEPIIEPQNTFSAISFGRIESDNDIIKQNHLVVRSFSKFSKKCNTELPTLTLIGVDEPDNLINDKENEITTISNDETNSYTNIYVLPYMNDRVCLFNELRSKSVSMMLSLSEGFGLVGLESISAGVPLILSTKSGLYKYLKNEGLDLLVTAINISGTNSGDKNESDIDNVLQELNKIYNNSKSYKRRALCLLKELEPVLTWENAVYSFLRDLGVGYLDFEYQNITFDEELYRNNDLISSFQKHNFKMINNSKIIQFASDKYNAFETNSFYEILLQEADKHLWIWGRKNSKLFSIGNSNNWFFNDLQRKIKNGFDFKCLFLNPFSNSETLKKAQKDKEDFENDLKICIRKAKEKCGENYYDICRFYDFNRECDVILRVDNQIIFTPIIKDSKGLPEHLTGSEFYITDVNSVLGKKLLKNFDEAWVNAKTPHEIKI